MILGSEFDEEEMHSDDEDSDDSWTTQEEFTSELILRYVSLYVCVYVCVFVCVCLCVCVSVGVCHLHRTPR